MAAGAGMIAAVRAFVGIAALFAVASCVVLPSVALATNDNAQDAVGGVGSKWFSGTLDSQDGENCSIAIIGDSYTEPMVSAIAGYGGAPGGGVVKVGDRYYANVLISIPGNPCGPGSAFVGTDLVLPHGTSVDTSAADPLFRHPARPERIRRDDRSAAGIVQRRYARPVLPGARSARR